MAVIYNGVELEGLDKDVHMIHSEVIAIMGHDNFVNTDYIDKLFQFKRADLPEEKFNEINKLNSVLLMNYQICNGGIEQYFENGYHKHDLSSDKEREIFDKFEQSKFLEHLASFASEIFPENADENKKLDYISDFLDSLDYEVNAPVFDTVYCEEDEEIWDDDLEDWIKNPDYFEPYEDVVDYENKIISNDGFPVDKFDDMYYEISDYLEKVAEAYAQYLYKSFEKEFGLGVDQLLSDAAGRVVEGSAGEKATVEKGIE